MKSFISEAVAEKLRLENSDASGSLEPRPIIPKTGTFAITLLEVIDVPVEGALNATIEPNE